MIKKIKSITIIHKLLYVLMMAFILTTSFGIIASKTSVFGADSEFDINVSYLKHKKVVVLLDNSGSMDGGLKQIKIDNKNIMLNRMDYALYSIGILASTLNDSDELTIVPLNKNHGEANNSESIKVDLKNNDRKQAVQQAYQRLIEITGYGTSYYYGGTPFNKPVENALNILDAPKVGSGSSLNDNNDEYWFVMLSDGAFDGMSSTDPNALCNNLTNVLAPYQSLHTIYIGFAAGLDLSTTSFVNTVSNSAYLAADGESLIQTMQKVSNQVSGKYDLNTTAENWNAAYAINDNQIIIELDNIGFSVKDVSFLLQESSASFSKVELVEGKNKTELKNFTLSSYSQKASQDVGKYKCYIGKLVYGNDEVFPTGNGQKLIFTFNGSVEGASISLFAEPALYIETYYEYLDGSTWKECDELFISSSLRPNDKIRVGYHILDYTKSKRIPTNIFDYSKLTYCGNTYSLLPDTTSSTIPLEKGSHEVSIEVGIKSGNSTSYSLYKTLALDIQENPTTFRVEGEMVEEQSNNVTYQNAKFKVYCDDTLVNKQKLESEFQYVLTVKEPNSLVTKTIPAKDYSISESGEISYRIECKNFGDYKAEFKVLRTSNGALRGTSVMASYMPKSIQVEYIGSELALSELQVPENKQAMEFKLTSDGKEFNFENSLLKYEVKLTKNGVTNDITNSTIVNGGVLTFVPTTQTLGKDNASKGEATITVKASCESLPSLNSEASAKLTIKEPVYEVEIIEIENNEIDLYNLKKLNTTIYIRFTCDGETLKTDQIRKELRNGNINLSVKTLGPTRYKQKIVDYEGNDCLQIKIAKEGLLRRLHASITIIKDAPIKVEYHGKTSDTLLKYKKINFMRRVETWVIYAIVIFLAIYIAGVIFGVLSRRTMLWRGEEHLCVVFERDKVTLYPINHKDDFKKFIFLRLGWLFKKDKKHEVSVDDVTLKTIDGDVMARYEVDRNKSYLVSRYSESADAKPKLKKILTNCDVMLKNGVIQYESTYKEYANEYMPDQNRRSSDEDKNSYALSRDELSEIFRLDSCKAEEVKSSDDFQYSFDTSKYFVVYNKEEVKKVIKFI